MGFYINLMIRLRIFVQFCVALVQSCAAADRASKERKRSASGSCVKGEEATNVNGRASSLQRFHENLHRNPKPVNDQGG